MTSDTPTATAKSSSQHQAANRSIVTGRFSKPEFLGELFDNNDLNATPISDYKIQWDAPKGLTSNTFGNDRPFAPWPSQHTTQTILSEHEITRVMALLQYNIALRLNSDTNIKTPQKIVPYPIAARVDAVRVLGCLRPTSFASYVIWQRLRVFSTTKFIDQDSSNETQADLRALGQIDIPAVKFLGERIASEWDTKQQRAANYALSKVLGRYSLPFIEHEIAVRELAAKDDSELHDQYLDEVKRLKDMLELGKEKEWFTGDYYGAHDPHAYDLVFDDTPAPAKTP